MKKEKKNCLRNVCQHEQQPLTILSSSAQAGNKSGSLHARIDRDAMMKRQLLFQLVRSYIMSRYADHQQRLH